MVVFLRESDLRKSLRMEDAISALELALREQGKGRTSMPPRMRVNSQNGRLMVMPASIEGMNYLGMKAYTVFKDVRFLLLLYSSKDGSLLAIMDADYISQVRTGGVSAVATKWMTAATKKVVGIFGSGIQARTQLQALHSIGRVERARVFSPNPTHRNRYAYEMSRDLDVEVIAVESPQEAARNSGIICCATPSTQPVVASVMLEAGSHVNAIGSTLPSMRELDDETIGRARMLIVDSREQVLDESGDIMIPLKKGIISRDEISELSDLVLGREVKRHSGDLTIFKSVGTAVQDIAVGSVAYETAVKRGLGVDLGEITSRKAAT